MVEQVLGACRVLVVEDEYTIAEEICFELKRVGAVVIGPVGQLRAAIDLVRTAPEIDVSVLDLNLGGETVFPLADLLAERGVPIIFATGYDAQSIPSRFAPAATLVKPVAISAMVKAVSSAIIAR